MSDLVTPQIQIKRSLLLMGGYVEKAVDQSLAMLFKRHTPPLAHLYSAEEAVNRLHKEVDQGLFEYCLGEKLCGESLRFVLVATKMNTELERMGDQAVNIAESTQFYLQKPSVRDLGLLEELGQETQKMLRSSLDAFAQMDAELADRLFIMTDLAENSRRRWGRQLVDGIRTRSIPVGSAMDLILISRNLERIGEHACSIAQLVLFLCRPDGSLESSHGLCQDQASWSKEAFLP